MYSIYLILVPKSFEVLKSFCNKPVAEGYRLLNMVRTLHVLTRWINVTLADSSQCFALQQSPLGLNPQLISSVFEHKRVVCAELTPGASFTPRIWLLCHVESLAKRTDTASPPTGNHPFRYLKRMPSPSLRIARKQLKRKSIQIF